MRKRIFIVIAIILLPLIYWRFFYPPNVLEREGKNAIAIFGFAVASQDRAAVAETLKTLIADDAKIQLEVTLVQFLQEQRNDATTQDFDKASFITFVDNILYTLTDYSYESWIDSFRLSEDHKSAKYSYVAESAASGGAYYAGTRFPMRFTAEINCDGQLSYVTGKPQISEQQCRVKFRSLPQSSAQERSRKPDVIKNLR